MDGGADPRTLRRMRLRSGSYYHVFRKTWRRLGRVEDLEAALARYRELESIIGELDNRLDAAAAAWGLPKVEPGRPRGPAERAQRGRDLPPRMHRKNGHFYHVFRSKWRPLGPENDYKAALEAYQQIEQAVVDPAKRKHRDGRRARHGSSYTPKRDSGPEQPDADPPRAPAQRPVSRPAWRGYYGGGTAVT